MRIATLLALLCAGAAFAGEPNDDPRADAEAMLARGEKLMQQKKYKEAIAVFSAARAIAPDKPGPLLYLGLAYAAADRCADALPVLDEYLRQKGDEAKPEAVRARAACKAATQPRAAPVTAEPSQDPLAFLAARMKGTFSEEGHVFGGPGGADVPFRAAITCDANSAWIRCQARLHYGGAYPSEDVRSTTIRWDPDALVYRMSFRDHNGTFDYVGRADGNALVADYASADLSVRLKLLWDFTHGVSRVEMSTRGAPYRLLIESRIERLR